MAQMLPQVMSTMAKQFISVLIHCLHLRQLGSLALCKI